MFGHPQSLQGYIFINLKMPNACTWLDDENEEELNSEEEAELEAEKKAREQADTPVLLLQTDDLFGCGMKLFIPHSYRNSYLLGLIDSPCM